MSVRNAVEQREHTPAKVSLKAEATRAIQQTMPTLQDVLPKGFDAARWSQVVTVAIKSKPQLLECLGTKEGKESLLLACIQAAELGLEPDTPLGDAWLLPRRNKGVMEAQLSVSYRGLAKLAMQHPDVAQVVSGTVREGDHFIAERGLLVDRFEHRPAPSAQRGELTHAYAIIRLRGGGADWVVLDEGDIEKAREMSDSWKNTTSRPYSPWTKHTAAQWEKTAIRRLCTSTPYRTVALAQAVDVDERRLALDGERIITLDEVPEQAALTPVPPAPDAADADEDSWVDPDTGEVVEGGEPFQ